MAKVSRSTSFKGAQLCIECNTITEVTKDETRVYNLNKVLKEWDGVENVSITIKKEDDLPEDGDQ